jgi:hypothetical protein
MKSFDRRFPALLADLLKLDFDYADGQGIDFEPFQEFRSAQDVAHWFKAWTGNPSVDGAEYRLFGMNKAGGYAAFWMVRADKPVLEQPVVFFGSEGELAVLASNFSDYLWLLADGVGPREAAGGDLENRAPTPHLAGFAGKHASTPRRAPKEIIEAALSEFPKFCDDVQALCR